MSVVSLQRLQKADTDSPLKSPKRNDTLHTLMLAHWVLLLAKGSCLAYGYAPCFPWVVSVGSVKVSPSGLDLEWPWRTISIPEQWVQISEASASLPAQSYLFLSLQGAHSESTLQQTSCMQISASECLLGESCRTHTISSCLRMSSQLGTSRERVVAKGESFLNSKIDDAVLERTSAGR